MMMLRPQLLILLLLFGCSSAPDPYHKFEIEEAILTYRMNWTGQSIEVKTYFSNYGATEYMEFLEPRPENLGDIFKIDSLEHLFVGDSMTVHSSRSYSFLFDSMVFLPESKLNNPHYCIASESDTLIQGYPCRLIHFYKDEFDIRGKVALWKNIPLWGVEFMDAPPKLWESMEMIELDLETEIPEEKKRLMEWVDTGL